MDEKRRVWLWGTYKDSNGYIGIAHKRKQETEVLEKSAEPTLVLEGSLQVASGADHTVALAAPSGHNQVFAWGSNATGQLGLQEACGLSERILPCSGSIAGLAPREGGGCEVAGEQVVRIHQADGFVRAATSMTAEQVEQAVVQGGAGEHVASRAQCSFIAFEDCAVSWFWVERRWPGWTWVCAHGRTAASGRARRAKGFLDRRWTAQHPSAGGWTRVHFGQGRGTWHRLGGEGRCELPFLLISVSSICLSS